MEASYFILHFLLISFETKYRTFFLSWFLSVLLTFEIPFFCLFSLWVCHDALVRLYAKHHKSTSVLNKNSTTCTVDCTHTHTHTIFICLCFSLSNCSFHMIAHLNSLSRQCLHLIPCTSFHVSSELRSQIAGDRVYSYTKKSTNTETVFLLWWWLPVKIFCFYCFVFFYP